MLISRQRKPPSIFSHRLSLDDGNIYIFVVLFCTMILERVRQAFAAYPAQKAVAEKMLELGLSVGDHSVCCGDVDVKEVSLAQNCRVDRRAVTATLGRIRKDPFLNSVFKSL